MYLPLFGFTQAQQNLYLWKQQLPQYEVGTVTVPYPFDSPDETLGWSVLPNMRVNHSKKDLWDVAISTNSIGLRGNEIEVQTSSENNLRVGIFGASQTFGESVNDKEEYASVIASIEKDISVLNFGVRGYGTDQMLLKYKDAVTKFDFDIVILAFAFHHIPRNVSSFTFHAKPYFETNQDKLILKGSPIPDAFHLYDLTIPDVDDNFFNKSIALRYLLQLYRQYKQNKHYDITGRAWNITLKIIQEFSKIAKQNNSRFVLVNIEEKFEDEEIFLERFSEIQGIEYFNLGPILRDNLSDNHALYVDDNHHWTRLGHKLVAKNIIELLKCHEINNNCLK